MKISEEEIQEEIKNATKEQDVLRRVFSIIMESHWDDNKLIPYYCKSFQIERSLGKAVNAIVQKTFPKWYTKHIKIHKAEKLIELQEKEGDKGKAKYKGISFMNEDSHSTNYTKNTLNTEATLNSDLFKKSESGPEGYMKIFHKTE